LDQQLQRDVVGSWDSRIHASPVSLTSPCEIPWLSNTWTAMSSSVRPSTAKLMWSSRDGPVEGGVVRVLTPAYQQTRNRGHDRVKQGVDATALCQLGRVELVVPRSDPGWRDVAQQRVAEDGKDRRLAEAIVLRASRRSQVSTGQPRLGVVMQPEGRPLLRGCLAVLMVLKPCRRVQLCVECRRRGFAARGAALASARRVANAGYLYPVGAVFKPCASTDRAKCAKTADRCGSLWPLLAINFPDPLQRRHFRRLFGSDVSDLKPRTPTHPTRRLDLGFRLIAPAAACR
jgi:hypothetical protein